MAQQQPLTPEENLLRIIETPPEIARTMRRRQRVNFDAKLYFKLLQAKYGDKVRKLVTLRTVNVTALALGAIMTLFLLVDFWTGLPRAEALQKLEVAARASGVGDLNIEEVRPEALYLQEITGRNIFALTASAPPQVPDLAMAQKIAENKIAEQLVTTYRLVGIIWSEAPQAILEEVKDGKTHLVNRGAMLGQARIKDILKDHVVLSYDGKDIELR